MYCNQCGGKLLDHSKICLQCGSFTQNFNLITYPYNDNSNTINKRLVNRKLIVVASSLLVIISLITVVIIRNSNYVAMLENSKENISPYLEYLSSDLNEDGEIELDSEIGNNMDNVKFCEMAGQVSYYADQNDKTVTQMIWASHDLYSHEEYTKLSDILCNYFGTLPVVEVNYKQFGQYNDITYYWTDDSISCTVILCTSVRANHENENTRIEVCWDMETKIPLISRR